MLNRFGRSGKDDTGTLFKKGWIITGNDRVFIDGVPKILGREKG